MFRRILTHIRSQPVAFIALFFALGGGAMAANTYLRSTDTIPAGDLAGSAYGDPLIAAGKVINTKLANSSLTVSGGTGLTGGGLVALGGSTSLGVANGGIGAPQLADGAVTTSKFGSGAQAPDSARLAGADATDYAVLSGRINGLGATGGAFGAPSGVSTASLNDSPAVETGTPDHTLVARDFSIRLTVAPGAGIERDFYLFINNGLPGFAEAPICQIADPATTHGGEKRWPPVGTSDGHQRGETMATSGEFRGRQWGETDGH